VGVFKNKIGRPSNDTLRKRKILYIIIAIILILALSGSGVLLYSLSKKNDLFGKENLITYSSKLIDKVVIEEVDVTSNTVTIKKVTTYAKSRRGDVNKDGKLGNDDYEMLLHSASNTHADVNSDGKITFADAKLVLRASNYYYCVTTINDINTCSWRKTNKITNLKADTTYYIFVKSYDGVSSIGYKTTTKSNSSAETIKTYTATFYTNISPIEKKCDISDTKNSCNIEVPAASSQTGYEVLGYATTADSVEVAHKVGDTITLKSDISLYLITGKPCTINYHRADSYVSTSDKLTYYFYNGSGTASIKLQKKFSISKWQLDNEVYNAGNVITTDQCGIHLYPVK